MWNTQASRWSIILCFVIGFGWPTHWTWSSHPHDNIDSKIQGLRTFKQRDATLRCKAATCYYNNTPYICIFFFQIVVSNEINRVFVLRKYKSSDKKRSIFKNINTLLFIIYSNNINFLTIRKLIQLRISSNKENMKKIFLYLWCFSRWEIYYISCQLKILWINVYEKNKEKHRNQCKINIKLTQNGTHNFMYIFLWF